jgi:hypothetical protein
MRKVRLPSKQERTEPYYAYAYARDIIKGRWEKGEPIIAKDPYSSHHYATEVIKKRFKMAEPMMAKNAEIYYVYLYVRDVIKGRWEQGEEAIMKDKEYVLHYAEYLLKYELKHIDFYIKCLEQNILDIHELPQHLQDNEDIQVAYFKAKILK